MQAWAEKGRPVDWDGRQAAAVQDVVVRFRDWLDPALLERLCACWDHDVNDGAALTSRDALERLCKLHRESARVDLARAHASWWVRALKDESPAVQRIVTASVPESIRGSLQNGLLLDSDDLKTERPPSPDVLSWAMSLWTERLVGGETERPDDPPALIVLTRLSPRSGYRLCRLMGLAKLALAAQDPSKTDVVSARRQWLCDHLPIGDAGLLALARQDAQSGFSSQVPDRHRQAGIGLATIARLLAGCGPVRLRWALQHWPYPLARPIRSLMVPAPGRPLVPAPLDLLILKAAWDRLNLEGKLAISWPSLPGESTPST
jgi:hypothetical protein